MSFKKGVSGNPKGRPRGTSKTADREQREQQVRDLIDALVKRGLAGDIEAARLALSQLAPPPPTTPLVSAIEELVRRGVKPAAIADLLTESPQPRKPPP